jgi:hypothetical protein
MSFAAWKHDFALDDGKPLPLWYYYLQEKQSLNRDPQGNAGLSLFVESRVPSPASGYPAAVKQPVNFRYLTLMP